MAHPSTQLSAVDVGVFTFFGSCGFDGETVIGEVMRFSSQVTVTGLLPRVPKL